jgi:DNA primase large subunit
MQFVAVGNRSQRDLKYQSSTISLSLYNIPPEEELSLDEFELLSLDRLQLLRSIEIMKTRGFEEAELNSKIMEAEKKHLISRKDQFPRFSLEQRDKISHFILRLAFCRSEDLRRWFITQECILFKYRLDALSDDQRQVFMAQNGISYEIVSAEERARKASLLTNLAGVKSDSIDRTTFYK